MPDFRNQVMDGLTNEPQVLIKAEIVVPMTDLDWGEFDTAVEAFQAHGSFEIKSVKTITPKHPKYLKQGG